MARTHWGTVVAILSPRRYRDCEHVACRPLSQESEITRAIATATYTNDGMHIVDDNDDNGLTWDCVVEMALCHDDDDGDVRRACCEADRVRARSRRPRDPGVAQKQKPENATRKTERDENKIKTKLQTKKKHDLKKKNKKKTFLAERRPRTLRTGPLKDEAAVLLSVRGATNAPSAVGARRTRAVRQPDAQCRQPCVELEGNPWR